MDWLGKWKLTKMFGLLPSSEMSSLDARMELTEQESAATAGQSVEKTLLLRLMIVELLTKNSMLQQMVAKLPALNGQVAPCVATKNGSMDPHRMQGTRNIDHGRLIDGTFDPHTAKLDLNDQQSLRRPIKGNSKVMLAHFHEPIANYAGPPYWESMHREKPTSRYNAPRDREGNRYVVDQEVFNYGERPYYRSTLGCPAESSMPVPCYSYAQSSPSPKLQPIAADYQHFTTLMSSNPNPRTERKSLEQQLRLNIALLKYEQNKERPSKSKFFGIDDIAQHAET